MPKILFLILVVSAWGFCMGNNGWPGLGSSKGNLPNYDCHLPEKNSQKCPEFVFGRLRYQVSFKCPLSGATYEFYMKKMTQKSQFDKITTKDEFTVSGDTLSIMPMKMKHIGREYECRTTDAKGIDQKWFWVLHNSKMPKLPIMGAATAYTGESHVFNCALEIHYIYTLYKSDSLNTKKYLFSTSDSRLMHDSKGVYQLNNLVVSDSGFYYCGREDKAKNMVYSPKMVNLTVVDNAIQRATLENYVYIKGEAAKFTCFYKKQAKSISWYKDGKMIMKENKKLKLILTFAKLTMNDAGDYECRVKTVGGKTIFQKTTLKVSGVGTTAVEIRRATNDMHLYKKGDTAHFTCVYTTLAQHGAWYRHGKKIKNNVVRTKVNDKIKLTLKFANLTGSDAGDYECRVQIGARKLQQKATLKVLDFQATPTIKKFGGNAMLIACGANQNNVTYTLLKKKLGDLNGKLSVVHIPPGGYISVSLNKADFYFSTMLPSDKGMYYVCRASVGSISIQTYVDSVAE